MTAPNRVSLSGIGVGVNWRPANLWTVTTSIATPTGSRPPGQQQARTGVLWASVSRSF